MLPGLREACGVFGVYAPGEDVARITFFGLYALQHRGQESAGIAPSNSRTLHLKTGMGLVSQVFDEDDAWDVLEDLPNDSAAALLLLEHHWAVPLRDAVVRAGGFRISEGFISPLDLVAIGLLTAEEAKELHAQDKAAATTSS